MTTLARFFAKCRFDVETTSIPVVGDAAFSIARSEGASGSALIPADVATCAECLSELLDPANRRFRYPFINCTQC